MWAPTRCTVRFAVTRQPIRNSSSTWQTLRTDCPLPEHLPRYRLVESKPIKQNNKIDGLIDMCYTYCIYLDIHCINFRTKYGRMAKLAQWSSTNWILFVFSKIDIIINEFRIEEIWYMNSNERYIYMIKKNLIYEMDYGVAAWNTILYNGWTLDSFLGRFEESILK